MGKQFLLESCGTAFARFPELSDFRFIPLGFRLQSCQPLRPCLFPTPQFRFLKLAFPYQRVPCRSIRSGRPQVVPTCLVGFHTGFQRLQFLFGLPLFRLQPLPASDKSGSLFQRAHFPIQGVQLPFAARKKSVRLLQIIHRRNEIGMSVTPCPYP